MTSGRLPPQMAVIGIFILLLGACFYFCRPLLLPIMAAW